MTDDPSPTLSMIAARPPSEPSDESSSPHDEREWALLETEYELLAARQRALSVLVGSSGVVAVLFLALALDPFLGAVRSRTAFEIVAVLLISGGVFAGLTSWVIRLDASRHRLADRQETIASRMRQVYPDAFSLAGDAPGRAGVVLRTVYAALSILAVSASLGLVAGVVL